MEPPKTENGGEQANHDDELRIFERLFDPAVSSQPGDTIRRSNRGGSSGTAPKLMALFQPPEASIQEKNTPSEASKEKCSVSSPRDSSSVPSYELQTIDRSFHTAATDSKKPGEDIADLSPSSSAIQSEPDDSKPLAGESLIMDSRHNRIMSNISLDPGLRNSISQATGTPTIPVLKPPSATRSRSEIAAEFVGNRASPLHRRGISWDVNLGAQVRKNPSGFGQGNYEFENNGYYTSDSEDVLLNPPIPNHSSPGTTISGRRKLARSRHLTSLQDILQQHPLEVEAETLLLTAIEDLDPVGARSRSESDTTTSGGILHHVPHGAEDSISVGTKEGSSIRTLSTSTPGTSAPTKRKHRRQQTMEQRLDGLADALESMHIEEDGGPVEVHSPPEEVMLTASDNMNKHASVLFNRRRAMSEDVRKDNIDANHLESVYEQPGVEELENSSSRMDHDIETGVERTPNDHSEKSDKAHKSLKQRRKSRLDRVLLLIPGARELFEFMSANKGGIVTFVTLMAWIMVPSLVVAVILFELFENPPTGHVDDGRHASASWWLLFIGVRHVVTLAFAFATQLFFVDFLCIGRRWTSRYMGPIATLLIVQSRGWPFVLSWWSCYNLCLNAGAHPVILPLH